MIGRLVKRCMIPVYDVRSMAFANPASAKVASCWKGKNLYKIPWVIMPFKYFKRYWGSPQFVVLGEYMTRARRLTKWAISGRVKSAI